MQNHVLIAGASGLVGTACVDRFLEAGWRVTALSRRRPETSVDLPYTHLSVDLRNREEARRAIGQSAGITHLVHAALYEKPGLFSGWVDEDYIEINTEILRNTLDPVIESGELRHISLMQGTKAYGIHLHPMRIPAREWFPRDDHPNFYWTQEDYVKERADKHGFDFTIMRPQMVVGSATGVAMNLPPVIGAYAAICHEIREPFGFPGGAPWVWEAADARLIANALLWASTAPAAARQHYNITNGDVLEWRSMWPALAEALGVQSGPDHPRSLAEFLPAHADTWTKIVDRYGLRPVPLEQILGESHHFADFAFMYGVEKPPLAFVSTVKLRQHGFGEVRDTEECFVDAIRLLQKRRLLPRIGAHL